MNYNNGQNRINRGVILIRNKKTTLKEVAFTCQRPVSSVERVFEERSRSTMSGTSAFLKKSIKTEGFWKISINVNSKNEVQHLKVAGGVLRYNIEFNIPKFLSLSMDNQKIKMLNLVDQTLNKIFSDLYLDTEKLNGLKYFIRERQFESRFSGPISKHAGISAFVLCEQRFDQAEIFIIFKNGTKEIKRSSLLITSPEEFIFNVYLNKIQWISDKKLELLASNGEFFSINF